MTTAEFVAAVVLSCIGVVGLAVAVYVVLQVCLGNAQSALQQRLEQVGRLCAADRRGGIEKPRMSDGARWRRLLLELPKAAALDLLVIRSGSRYSTASWIAITLGLASAGFLTMAIALGLGAWVGLATGALCWALPLVYLRHQTERRRQRFEAQLPDALDFLSRSLRAGHGLSVALGAVGQQLPEPIGGEFRIAFEETNFGAPIDQALTRMAARVGSPDLDFFVVAVIIQRETGGNLAELLGVLAATVRERIKLLGKVRILSSEGRLTGVVLTALPFVMAGVMFLLNPGYIAPLWTTPTGQQMLAVVLGLMLFGYAWMSQVVKIKV